VPSISNLPVAGYGQLPLSFEINQGQTDPQVNFLARGSGYTLFLTPTEAVLSLQKPAKPAASAPAVAAPAAVADVLGMQLVGANPSPQAAGLDELPGKSNYFIGNDPSQWHTDVANYGRVAYADVYPGINLVYYGHQRQLEYDFQVAAGADPGRIRLAFPNVHGMELDGQGDLVLHTAGGDVVEQAPVLYQEKARVREAVAGHYVVHGADQVGFAVGAYDPRQVLVIDPVLSYSTYLGGSGHDYPAGTAVDAAGNAYVTGATVSTDFPTAHPLQSSYGGGNNFDGDAFVAKLNAAGSALVYSTYLGGSSLEWEGLGAIAVDAAGNAYVTGGTDSTDFPTAHPLQPAKGAGHDAFVAKLNAAGSALVYSTFLGGSSDDYGTSIAVDAAGNAYVTGHTDSTNFPTAHPLQPTYGGAGDAFVAKLSAAGSALVYSTYLGGSGVEYGYGIAADAAGNAYVTGETASTNFPTAHSLQPAYGGSWDAYVAKLNAAGSALVYASYLGGSDGDGGQGIAVDAAGNAYVTGVTNSTDFPTLDPLQPTYGGGGDAYVAELNAAGSALVYATYLGGSGLDGGWGIAVDAAGNAYITGLTDSTDFPTAHPLQPAKGAGHDAFVAKLNAAGSALVYSTFLGGSSDDFGASIAVDAEGSAYVVGNTSSTDFSTANPLQPASCGNGDVFIAKIGDSAAAAISMVSATTDGGRQLTVTYQITNSDLTAPFDLGFYRSDDALFDNSDTVLGKVTISTAADGTVGVHTKVFTIGGAAGQIALPGAGAAEITGDYHLLAVVDPANAVDAASAGKTAVLTGAYYLAGGGVFVQGGLDNDTLTLSVSGSNLSIILNGTSYSYAVSNTSLIHARTHAGDDTITIASTMSTTPVTINGGDGRDTLVGPNLTNAWTISSPNSGKVRNVSFTGMENLTGGTGADTFKFNGTGNVAGALSGGGGVDQLNF
jgi:hypothetical protein